MQASSEREGLPAPTGRYPVGRVSLDWVDSERAEIYSGNPADRRELVVWAWYPAVPQPDAKRADYLPEPWAPAGQFLGLDAVGLLSHAVTDAAVADDQSSYPGLVFSPSGFPPLLLAAIAEELASHGYVAVGVNHTYETGVTVFADGRVVPMNPDAVAGVLGSQAGTYEERFRQRAAVCDYKSADLASVADRLGQLPVDAAGPLAGRVDLSRLGAFGHSFGGNAALEWCRNDRRCLAAAHLDGALWTEVGRVGLNRPVLQVLAEHPEFAPSGPDAVAAGMATDAAAHDAEKAITFGGWRTVHQQGRPSYTVQVKGATHLSFMDVPLLPLQGDSPARAMLAATQIHPRRMWRITCDLLLAFFGSHLRRAGIPSALAGPSGDYPELSFGAP
ncbi:MAG: alpha/beta hydrolase family protein [Acidimicrobiales bacterium]